MAVIRPDLAMDPRRFGKAPAPRAEAQPQPAATLGDDLRLFAITFAAGFLFVSILIG
jgi:hypothetical protein